MVGGWLRLVESGDLVPRSVRRRPVRTSGAVTAVEPGSAMPAPAEPAVWDTIWLVAQLPGMTESYERLLEYGQMVNHGIPTRAAAILLLEIAEPPAACSMPMTRGCAGHHQEPTDGPSASRLLGRCTLSHPLRRLKLVPDTSARVPGPPRTCVLVS